MVLDEKQTKIFFFLLSFQRIPCDANCHCFVVVDWIIGSIAMLLVRFGSLISTFEVECIQGLSKTSQWMWEKNWRKCHMNFNDALKCKHKRKLSHKNTFICGNQRLPSIDTPLSVNRPGLKNAQHTILTIVLPGFRSIFFFHFFFLLLSHYIAIKR